MNNEQDLMQMTAEFVKEKFKSEGSGHDWWHLHRVWQLSKHIAKEEGGANMLVVELAALLHDIADWKFHDGDEEAGPKAAQSWLESIKVDDEIIKQVVYIVKHISFKGGVKNYVMESIEGKIVQDADRLDAIGAIGIARVFAFGGNFNRPIHEPDEKPKNYNNFEMFKKNLTKGSSINHFYEKLLLLKDKMNTKTGKKIAQRRHEFMEQYLKEFYAEWEGNA
jgi:uncharacterized protein